MKSYEINKVVDETPLIKTFYLKCGEVAEAAIPGQFLMVWVPLAEEIPISLSYICPEAKMIGITVRKIGETTEKMHELKKGDYLGIEGPYGKGYELKGEKILTISSGCATASLPPFIEAAQKAGKQITSILGGLNADSLIFKDRISELGVEVITVTGDGSHGIKGHVTDALVDLLRVRKFDTAYVCATERRMVKVLEILRPYNLPAQINLERAMKCGMGICGVCAMDPRGLLVCKDGPIFWSWEVEGSEFGIYKRDLSTSKIYF